MARMRYDRTKQEAKILKLIYGSSDVYKMSIIKGECGKAADKAFRLSKAGVKGTQEIIKGRKQYESDRDGIKLAGF